MQNQCAEIKLRTERKAGDILAPSEKNEGLGPARAKCFTLSRTETSFTAPGCNVDSHYEWCKRLGWSITLHLFDYSSQKTNSLFLR